MRDTGLRKLFEVRQGLDMWLAVVAAGARQVWKHRYMECYEKCSSLCGVS
jgi:hypothetical protein